MTISRNTFLITAATMVSCPGAWYAEDSLVQVNERLIDDMDIYEMFLRADMDMKKQIIIVSIFGLALTGKNPTSELDTLSYLRLTFLVIISP